MDGLAGCRLERGLASGFHGARPPAHTCRQQRCYAQYRGMERDDAPFGAAVDDDRRLRHWGHVYPGRCRPWALAPALAANADGPARHSRTPCLPGASSSSPRSPRLDLSGRSITPPIAISAWGQKRGHFPRALENHSHRSGPAGGIPKNIIARMVPKMELSLLTLSTRASISGQTSGGTVWGKGASAGIRSGIKGRRQRHTYSARQ